MINIFPDDIIYERPKRVVFPYSWVEHIPTAFKLVDILSPKIIVELGTHSGNSFCAFNQVVKKLNLNSKCFAIDTWEGDKHSGKYDQVVFNELSDYCKIHYSQTAFLIKKQFDDALDEFQNNSIDLLHIDGLHTYEAVSNDFYKWLPKLSNQGVVLFHDTKVFESDFGVHKFWKEIKMKYPSLEFFFGNGLGILFVGHSISKDCIVKLSEYQSNYLYNQFCIFQGSMIQANSERDEVKKEIERLRKYNNSLIFLVEKYRNSKSYFIGSLIVRPVSVFLKTFRAK